MFLGLPPWIPYGQSVHVPLLCKLHIFCVNLCSLCIRLRAEIRLLALSAVWSPLSCEPVMCLHGLTVPSLKGFLSYDSFLHVFFRVSCATPGASFYFKTKRKRSGKYMGSVSRGHLLCATPDRSESLHAWIGQTALTWGGWWQQQQKSRDFSPNKLPDRMSTVAGRTIKRHSIVKCHE